MNCANYGAIKGLNSSLENVFKKANTENKLCFAVGDFNLNYNKKLEIRTFYNRRFLHACIPFIKRPTRVTSKTKSLMSNISANFIFGTSFKLEKTVIKSDVRDHFPVFVSLYSPSKNEFIYCVYEIIVTRKEIVWKRRNFFYVIFLPRLVPSLSARGQGRNIIQSNLDYV